MSCLFYVFRFHKPYANQHYSVQALLLLYSLPVSPDSVKLIVLLSQFSWVLRSVRLYGPVEYSYLVYVTWRLSILIIIIIIIIILTLETSLYHNQLKWNYRKTISVTESLSKSASIVRYILKHDIIYPTAWAFQGLALGVGWVRRWGGVMIAWPWLLALIAL